MQITRYMDSVTISKDRETGKETIAITLTDEEILTAYRDQEYRQEYRFRLRDAETQLAEYLCFDPRERNSEEAEEFAEENGYWPWELVEENSPHYILDDVVDQLCDSYYCGTPDKYLFQEAFERAIEEQKEVKS